MGKIYCYDSNLLTQKEILINTDDTGPYQQYYIVMDTKAQGKNGP